MIPKIIHYCWLSNEPFPEKIQKCINSWKEKLPDYEIKLWDTKNFDVNTTKWTQHAYEKKQYAFVSDYIRFFVLYNFGGIYLDSDVEVLKSFNDILSYKFFFSYEYSGIPEAAVIGAEKNIPWIKECLSWYEKNMFLDKKRKEIKIIAPLVLKKCFEKSVHFRLLDTEEIKDVEDGVIFPSIFFSPKNAFLDVILANSDSYTIHHFNAGWLKKNYCTQIKKNIHLFFIRFLNKKNYNKVLYLFRKLKINLH